MASEYNIECPKYKIECDIESCPRFLVCPTIRNGKDGVLLGAGFCNEHGHRFFSDIPQDKITFEQNSSTTTRPSPLDATNAGNMASPIPTGKGFPFITYCDPERKMLRMKVIHSNGEEVDFPFKIDGEERWHYVLQFVRANCNRIELKPFKRGKPINLSLVFRNTEDHNHRQFYSFTRTTGGSKAKYWLEQTQLKKRSK